MGGTGGRVPGSSPGLSTTLPRRCGLCGSLARTAVFYPGDGAQWVGKNHDAARGRRYPGSPAASGLVDALYRALAPVISGSRGCDELGDMQRISQARYEATIYRKT